MCIYKYVETSISIRKVAMQWSFVNISVESSVLLQDYILLAEQTIITTGHRTIINHHHLCCKRTAPTVQQLKLRYVPTPPLPSATSSRGARVKLNPTAINTEQSYHDDASSHESSFDGDSNHMGHSVVACTCTCCCSYDRIGGATTCKYSR